MTDDVRDEVDLEHMARRRGIEAARRGVLDHPAERGELFSPEELVALDPPGAGADREDRRTV